MIIQGRTFVISGGASGLGRATASLLHEAQGYIAILDLNEDNGNAFAKELGASRAKFFECDVADTSSVEAATKAVIEWTHQTKAPIASVVAAAGVGFPGKIIDRKGSPLSLDSFETVVNINLRGTVDLIRQLLPEIVKNEPLAAENVNTADEKADAERGVLIMVASVAAYDGQPGQIAYSASKGGIASMTLPMARDLAEYGVRVVTIAPGVFESAMTAMMAPKVRKSLESVAEFPKRFGHATEFARLVKECITNPMLNATVVRLDGGVRMPSKM